MKFLSTLSLRRATLTMCIFCSMIYIFLSTLSLRRATLHPRSADYSCRFLSTLSLRRATIQLEFNSLESKHFYPRSPCGERLFSSGAKADSVSISIHALLAESDDFILFIILWRCTFLSTLSLRRATLLFVT